MKQPVLTIETLLESEEERERQITNAIVQINAEVYKKSEEFQKKIAALKTERLEARDWKTKNELSERLTQLTQHNPMRYLEVFKQKAEPYFGAVCIQDDNPKIGNREYVFGKQSLVVNSKVYIIDWRNAAVSALYYEYTTDDDYSEIFNGVDRDGIILDKRRYQFKHEKLSRIESEKLQTTLKKSTNGWMSGTSLVTSASRKLDEDDHQLVDIIALITPEQFRIITRQHLGCTYLTGGAGSGKTTVALHRLSSLQFNFPEKFRPERCLVIMFNRPLCEYIRRTTHELLEEKTQISTYCSWATQAITKFGFGRIECCPNESSEFEDIKKHSVFSKFIAQAAKKIRFSQNTSLASVLLTCYSTFSCATTIFSAEHQERFRQEALAKLEQKTPKVAFSDAAILLRLLQLTTTKPTVQALQWFDHILIDEAQDFSQIELETLKYATTSARSMTVCADTKQRILEFVDSSGFKSFQTELRRSGTAAETLTVNYRSSDAIMRIAAQIMQTQFESSGREGEPVQFYSEPSQLQCIQHLKERLTLIQKSQPTALTAIICKTKKDVLFLNKNLKNDFKLTTNLQDFNFKSGIILTNVHQVKGLEFTHVILWDPSIYKYRKTETDKNLLYVALTRASQSLEIIHCAMQQLCSYLQPIFGSQVPKTKKRRL